MSKILLNPDNGAPICGVTYENTQYFMDKPFEPGSPWKFEDDATGDFFLNTFQFLVELSVEDAKKYMKMDLLKCESCDYTTRTKTQLDLHMKGHQAEAELDELGIPVVRQTNKQSFKKEVQNNVQQQIDSEGNTFGDGYPGLTEGDGLIREGAKTGAIMSGN